MLVAALGVLISVIRRMAPVRRYEISESSMSPELLPGDYVVSVRWLPIGLGSIVVFEHPDRPGFFLTKRVVVSPGKGFAWPRAKSASMGYPWESPGLMAVAVRTASGSSNPTVSSC